MVRLEGLFDTLAQLWPFLDQHGQNVNAAVIVCVSLRVLQVREHNEKHNGCIATLLDTKVSDWRGGGGEGCFSDTQAPHIYDIAYRN